MISATPAILHSQLSSISAETAEVKLALEMQLPKGWHIYWKNPGEIGDPPRAKWKLETESESAWQGNPVFFPPPEKIKTRSSGQKESFAFGYKDKVFFPLLLTRKPDAKATAIHGKLSFNYLICDLQCVPESRELILNFPLASKEKVSRDSEQVEQTFNNLPQEIKTARAEWVNRQTLKLEIPADHRWDDLFIYSEADHKAGSPSITTEGNAFLVRWTESPPAQMEWTATATQNHQRVGVFGQIDHIVAANLSALSFLIALFFAFIGGVILNFMPCVLPVIGLKTFSLMQMRKKNSKENKRAMHYSLIGTIAGIIASFLVLAGLTLYLQRMGHQVGWGFQYQNSIFVVAMTALLFLFSLNLFGLFEFHLSSHLQSRLASFRSPFLEGVFVTILASPCTAPFLGTAIAFALSSSPLLSVFIFLSMGLGLSVPYIFLLLFPKALLFLPKPGEWMNYLRILFACLLLLSVVWLLHVLKSQTHSSFTMGAICALGAIFIVIREFKSGWKWAWVFAIICSGMVMAQLQTLDSFKTLARETELTPFSRSEWKKRLNSGENIFLDITADWCLTCKYNETAVISREWFSKILSDRGVHLMVVDWTRPNPEIAEFLKEHGRAGIPFSMIASKDRELIFPELLTQSVIEKGMEDFFPIKAPQ